MNTPIKNTPTKQGKRHGGRVKWFNAEKGYGFILPDDGGDDVFVHIRAVTDSGLVSIHEGESLTYSLHEHRGRISAVDLMLTKNLKSTARTVDGRDQS